MAKRLTLGDLPPAIQQEPMRHVLRAFLQLQVGRMRAVRMLREYGDEKATQLDVLVHLYVLVWTIEGGGTRQQPLADTLGMSRRTIRDVLRRLGDAGLVYRDDAGAYWSTDKGGHLVSNHSDLTFRDIARLSDAWMRLRRVTVA